MALVTFNRTSVTGTLLSKVLTNNGYVSISDSPLLGGIVSTLQRAIDERLIDLYSIAQNVDIGRATGEYLDRWGRFMNEPRTIPSYGSDLSLTNVYVELSPVVNAGTITNDARGLTLPKGVIISSSTTGARVRLLDDVYIRADRSRTYCRVVATQQGSTYVAPGTLDTVELPLSALSNILPSALRTYKLIAGNVSEITGGTSLSDDATYRYVLQQKAASLGVFNEGKVNAMLDLTDVADVSVNEYVGGAIVYIDTVLPELADIIVTNARQLLTESRTLGQSIQVYTPLIVSLKLLLQVEATQEDLIANVTSAVTQFILDRVNATRMGEIVSITSIINAAKENVDNVQGIRLMGATVNGRTLTSGFIGLHYNERITMVAGDITIS